MTEYIAKTLARISKLMIGRKVVKVGYMDGSTLTEDWDWWSGQPIIITLDNGVEVFPMSDEEGNNAGVLNTNIRDAEVIPIADEEQVPKKYLQKTSKWLVPYPPKKNTRLSHESKKEADINA